MGFCHAAPHDKSELACMYVCVRTPVTSIAIFLKISLIKASSKNLKGSIFLKLNCMVHVHKYTIKSMEQVASANGKREGF